MARHQYGIFAEGTRAHHHLEFSIRSGVSDAQLSEALVAVRAANADHRTTGGVNLVIGLGAEAWDRVRAGRSAQVVHDFPGYANEAARHQAPATQHDIWTWAHGSSTDV